MAVESKFDEQVLQCKEHGIPDDHIFGKGDKYIAENVLSGICGRRMDVIFSCEPTHPYWPCLADLGRVIECGRSDGTNQVMDRFPRNAIFASIDMVSLTSTKPTVISR